MPLPKGQVAPLSFASRVAEASLDPQPLRTDVRIRAPVPQSPPRTPRAGADRRAERIVGPLNRHVGLGMQSPIYKHLEALGCIVTISDL